MLNASFFNALAHALATTRLNFQPRGSIA